MSESIRDTRLSASALRPCFINKFVKSSSRGSTSGGIEWAVYPLTDVGSTITGPDVDDVDGAVGGDWAKDEVGGA